MENCAFQGAEVSVCVSCVAMIFRARALVLGQPGSCPLLRMDEPPRPGCLLAIY